MSGDSTVESEHEELKLLKEALWYSKWSMAFTIAALVVEAVALAEVFQDNFRAVFMLMALAGATYLFSRYLGSKSRQYRRRSDEVSR
jgi:hypothetical protein